MCCSFHILAVMCPSLGWQDGRSTVVTLSELLRVINFLRERFDQVAEVEVVNIFSGRHNVSVNLVEQQMQVLKTRQMIINIGHKGQFVAIDKQVRILNRVFQK